MRQVALCGLFAFMFSVGLFVSLAEAKKNDDNNENKGKSNYAVKGNGEYKNYKGPKDDKWYKDDYKGTGTWVGGGKSVPIPATDLLFGLGFIALPYLRSRLRAIKE
jgi:hypothetical protein